MVWFLVAVAAATDDASVVAEGSVAPVSADDELLAALDTELQRTMAAWEGAEAAPYYLSYRVVDTRTWTVSARYGAIDDDRTDRHRDLDVSARVGSPARDSTHRLKGDFVMSTNVHLGQRLPVDGPPEALRAAVWMATHKEVSDARERWLRVQANQAVKVADEDASADFSTQVPAIAIGDPAELPLSSEGPTLPLDASAWASTLVGLSRILDASPDAHRSSADLRAVAATETFVSSEGARVRHGREWLRVSLSVSTTLDDGMDLQLYRWKDVADPSMLPDRETLGAWADDLVADLAEMRQAAPGEPYSGPVLLRGRAAGVFVHEVLGHRAEGHRQKDEDEGHTFKDKVGAVVMPETVSVVDDPTLPTYAGEALNGHYAYDQEGVAAQRVVLVDRGVFRGFLMSRSPIDGFDASNGHGRAAGWRQPVSRMANTILETTDPQPPDVLRRTLRGELKRQDREWGLLVDEIAGGFTLTGRTFPNAFNVRAVTAWKVFADGRPDERVRGVDLVGTPLVALSNVMAVGDDPAVFNGFCGAESGMVPNSAVSPSLLLRTLEVQKKEKGADRPPLLSKPRPQGDT
jgi:TldD protein